MSRFCQRCGLPMSTQHATDEDGETVAGEEYVCDGPNDETRANGCWSVEGGAA